MDTETELQDPITTLGLLFSQVAMAAARVRDGRTRGRRDEAALVRMGDWLRDAAAWLRYAEHGGTIPATPSFLASELAQGPWLLDDDGRDAEDLAKRLEALATSVQRLLSPDVDTHLAGDIYSTFQTWAERARTEAGTSGDSILVP